MSVKTRRGHSKSRSLMRAVQRGNIRTAMYTVDHYGSSEHIERELCRKHGIRFDVYQAYKRLEKRRKEEKKKRREK